MHSCFDIVHIVGHTEGHTGMPAHKIIEKTSRTKTLTKAVMVGTKPRPGTRITVSFDAHPGLRAIFHPNGDPYFEFYFKRKLAGQQVRKRVSIGVWDPRATAKTPANPFTHFNGTIKSAKDVASEWGAMLDNGVNPAVEIKRREEAETEGFKSFDDWVAEFLDEARAGKRSTSTIEHYGFMFRHVSPLWEGSDITKVDEEDVTAVLRLINDKVNKGKKWKDWNPATANRVRTALSALFEWMHKKPLSKRPINHNPVRNTEKLGIEGATRKEQIPAEKARDRILTDSELEAIWKTGASSEGVYGKWLCVLMLTGARKGELAGVSRIDGYEDREDGPWIRLNNKNKPVWQPVTGEMLKIFATMSYQRGEEWLFPSTRRDGPIDPRDNTLKRIQRVSGTSDWTFHDIRRTVATRCQEVLDMRERDVKLLLGHSLGTGVTQKHYTSTNFPKQHRQAAEDWTAYLLSIVGEVDWDNPPLIHRGIVCIGEDAA